MLRSFDVLKTSLTIITGVLFFLTIYAVVQDNLALFQIEPSKVLSLKILETSTAATLFVTLIGALVVRHQFVVSLRPRIGYWSKFTVGEHATNEGKSSNVWQVRITNSGLGAAIITSTYFMIQGSGNSENAKLQTEATFIAEMTERNLILDKHYWIDFVSNGFTLSPEKDFCLFEIQTEQVGKIDQLEAVIYFQGLLGEKYVRTISLLPRRHKQTEI